MAIRCDWLVLCKRVLEDANTRTLTLVDCLDQLLAPSFPWSESGFAFAAYFSRDNDQDHGSFEFRLVRLDEGDDERAVFEGDGEWPAAVDRMRVFVNFATIQLSRAETLRYRVDWRRPKQRWSHGPAVPLAVGLLEPGPPD